jgi:Zn-dependent alcohol dehydrogenase
MPDGTSRLSKDGKTIYHFMGCSTFAEYAVISEISAAKIDPGADLYKMCLLGCGVSTGKHLFVIIVYYLKFTLLESFFIFQHFFNPGWGAVFNTVKMEPEKSVAVFGLGALGLSVIQASKMAGARSIVGVDLNELKFDGAKAMGATECISPAACPNGDVKTWLLNKEKWGYDYTFDCTGNVDVMRCALEVAHRGWGESCVIGVAAAGKEISTRPFQLVTGRQWKGTAFGGWKSRREVPRLVQVTCQNRFCKPYIPQFFNPSKF